jgi:microsomal dipeptidase-like Zn-dependent dipeptidase
VSGLVHLQLVHYRVSELGDISTEQPVHGGLTPFGREVIAACNRLGILVDVANGTDYAGLPSSVMPGYAEFPMLEEALVKRGIKADDIENMLGRNCLRVLGQSLAG